MTEIKPVYSGEAQLVRWAQSGGAGHTITLRIFPDTSHPFDGLKFGDNGQLMEIACVLKDDHEQPIDPAHARKNSSRHKARKSNDSGPVDQESTFDTSTKVEPAPLKPTGEDRDKPRHFRDMPRSQQAAIKCQDVEFIRWLWTVCPDACARHSGFNDFADRVLKERLGITSKKQLDFPDSTHGAKWDALLASYDFRDQVR